MFETFMFSRKTIRLIEDKIDGKSLFWITKTGAIVTQAILSPNPCVFPPHSLFTCTETESYTICFAHMCQKKNRNWTWPIYAAACKIRSVMGKEKEDVQMCDCRGNQICGQRNKMSGLILLCGRRNTKTNMKGSSFMRLLTLLQTNV